MEDKNFEIEDCLEQAILKMIRFVEETTGQKPDQHEIAAALSKYFVLKEILEFITMSRQESGPKD